MERSCIETMDRAILKIRARELIRHSQPSIIRAGLLFLIISLLFSLLSSYLVGVRVNEQDIMQMNGHIENGNAEYALAYMAELSPSPGAQLINLLLQIVMNIVSVGFIIFLLNSIRANAPCFGNLLDGFGMPWKIIWLNFLTGLFVMLWSLLLLIPGIIAAYRYRLAVYLLIDHPEYSAMQCIRESKRLMTGRKWELFMLDLSFFGWALLGVVPVIGWIVEIWNTPYFATTYALYYEAVTGHGSAQNRGYGGYGGYGGDGYNNYSDYNNSDWL